jgi:hypothetical protein
MVGPFAHASSITSPPSVHPCLGTAAPSASPHRPLATHAALTTSATASCASLAGGRAPGSDCFNIGTTASMASAKSFRHWRCGSNRCCCLLSARRVPDRSIECQKWVRGLDLTLQLVNQSYYTGVLEKRNKGLLILLGPVTSPVCAIGSWTHANDDRFQFFSMRKTNKQTM